MTFDLDIWRGEFILTLPRSGSLVDVIGQNLRSREENIPFTVESERENEKKTIPATWRKSRLELETVEITCNTSSKAFGSTSGEGFSSYY